VPPPNDLAGWIEAHGGDAERTLLLVAGAAFLGTLGFLGEGWDSLGPLRRDVLASLAWFVHAMAGSLLSASVRVGGSLAPRPLLSHRPFRGLYLAGLAAALSMLIHGGISLLGALGAGL
jgi:hypothetical protein